MKILIDTNILLDFIIGREPFYENADKILNLCVNKKALLCFYLFDHLDGMFIKLNGFMVDLV